MQSRGESNLVRTRLKPSQSRDHWCEENAPEPARCLRGLHNLTFTLPVLPRTHPGLGTYFPGNLLCDTPAGTHVRAYESILIQSWAEIIVL